MGPHADPGHARAGVPDEDVERLARRARLGVGVGGDSE